MKSNKGFDSFRVGKVSNAFPIIISTFSCNFASMIFCLATFACSWIISKVVNFPSSGSARANQILLYPPKVPISKMFLSPLIIANR